MSVPAAERELYQGLELGIIAHATPLFQFPPNVARAAFANNNSSLAAVNATGSGLDSPTTAAAPANNNNNSSVAAPLSSAHPTSAARGVPFVSESSIAMAAPSPLSPLAHLPPVIASYVDEASDDVVLIMGEDARTVLFARLAIADDVNRTWFAEKGGNKSRGASSPLAPLAAVDGERGVQRTRLAVAAPSAPSPSEGAARVGEDEADEDDDEDDEAGEGDAPNGGGDDKTAVDAMGRSPDDDDDDRNNNEGPLGTDGTTGSACSKSHVSDGGKTPGGGSADFPGSGFDFQNGGSATSGRGCGYHQPLWDVWVFTAAASRNVPVNCPIVAAKRPCTRAPRQKPTTNHGASCGNSEYSTVAAVVTDAAAIAFYRAPSSNGRHSDVAAGGSIASGPVTSSAMFHTSPSERAHDAAANMRGTSSATYARRNYIITEEPLTPFIIYSPRPDNQIRFRQASYPVRAFYWLPSPVKLVAPSHASPQSSPPRAANAAGLDATTRSARRDGAAEAAGSTILTMSPALCMAVVSSVHIEVVQVFPSATGSSHAVVSLKQFTTKSDHVAYDRHARLLLSVNKEKATTIKAFEVFASDAVQPSYRGWIDAREAAEGMSQWQPPPSRVPMAVKAADATPTGGPPSQQVGGGPTAQVSLSGEGRASAASRRKGGTPIVTLDLIAKIFLPDDVHVVNVSSQHQGRNMVLTRFALLIVPLTVYNERYVAVATEQQHIILYRLAHEPASIDMAPGTPLPVDFHINDVLHMAERARAVMVIDNAVVCIGAHSNVAYAFDVGTYHATATDSKRFGKGFGWLVNKASNTDAANAADAAFPPSGRPSAERAAGEPSPQRNHSSMRGRSPEAAAPTELVSNVSGTQRVLSADSHSPASYEQPTNTMAAHHASTTSQSSADGASIFTRGAMFLASLVRDSSHGAGGDAASGTAQPSVATSPPAMQWPRELRRYVLGAPIPLQIGTMTGSFSSTSTPAPGWTGPTTSLRQPTPQSATALPATAAASPPRQQQASSTRNFTSSSAMSATNAVSSATAAAPHSAYVFRPSNLVEATLRTATSLAAAHVSGGNAKFDFYATSTPVLIDRERGQVHLLGLRAAAMAATLKRDAVKRVRFLANRRSPSSVVESLDILRHALFVKLPLQSIGLLFDCLTSRRFPANTFPRSVYWARFLADQRRMLSTMASNGSSNNTTDTAGKAAVGATGSTVAVDSAATSQLSSAPNIANGTVTRPNFSFLSKATDNINPDKLAASLTASLTRAFHKTRLIQPALDSLFQITTPSPVVAPPASLVQSAEAEFQRRAQSFAGGRSVTSAVGWTPPSNTALLAFLAVARTTLSIDDGTSPTGSAPLRFSDFIRAEDGVDLSILERCGRGAPRLPNNGGAELSGAVAGRPEETPPSAHRDGATSTAAAAPSTAGHQRPTGPCRVSQQLILREVLRPAVDNILRRCRETIERHAASAAAVDGSTPCGSHEPTFYENEHSALAHDVRYLRAAALECVRSVGDSGFEPTTELRTLIVDLCLSPLFPDFPGMHQLLMYRVLIEDTDLARRLIDHATEYPPFKQLGFDMLSRLNRWDEVVRIYLAQREPLRAVKIIIAKNVRDPALLQQAVELAAALDAECAEWEQQRLAVLSPDVADVAARQSDTMEALSARIAELRRGEERRRWRRPTVQLGPMVDAMLRCSGRRTEIPDA